MAPEEIREELVVRSRRAQLVHRPISLSTICALFICLVVVSLFARVALGQDLAMLIVVLFSGALCASIGALVSLLFEVCAATASLHFVPVPTAPSLVTANDD